MLKLRNSKIHPWGNLNNLLSASCLHTELFPAKTLPRTHALIGNGGNSGGGGGGWKRKSANKLTCLTRSGYSSPPPTYTNRVYSGHELVGHFGVKFVRCQSDFRQLVASKSHQKDGNPPISGKNTPCVIDRHTLDVILYNSSSFIIYSTYKFIVLQLNIFRKHGSNKQSASNTDTCYNADTFLQVYYQYTN